MSEITKLPDGSAFCTATVMSREEATKLPLKDRPLNMRVSSEIYHATFEAIGAASCCVKPNPDEERIYDAEKASQIVVDLLFKFADEMEKREGALRVENQTLKEEIEFRIKQRMAERKVYTAQDAGEMAALKSENEILKRRLDWLGNHNEIMICRYKSGRGWKYWLHRITPHQDVYNSLDEAIDAAMKGGE